jgi:hypothetical protein
MYIFISNDFRTEAKKLANLSKENVSAFKENCFNELAEDRITFLGHGIIKNEKVVFGDKELSPKEFVNILIKYNLPKNIKKIDLIGCYLGLFQDKLTFLEETLQELHKYKQYKDVEVRGFMYDDKDKFYTQMSMGFSTDEKNREKLTHLSCVLYTKVQAKARKEYDNAVQTQHEKSDEIQSDLYLKKQKIEKLNRELKSDNPLEETERLSIQVELELLNEDVEDLAKQLESVMKKKEEQYKKYEKSFEMDDYGKPKITQVRVEEIRKHLDLSICDAEESLNKKIKSQSEEKKEEKEKNLISLLQSRLQIPQLQPVGVIQQQITGASQGIPISQPVEVKINTSLSPAFQSRQEVEQSQVDSKQQTQQWHTSWLEFYRSMTLQQQEKYWDSLDQGRREIAFSLLTSPERLQVLRVAEQKNIGAQGIGESSRESEIEPAPAPSSPLSFRQNSPSSLGQSSSYYSSSSSTLFSSSSSSSSSSLSRSEPTSTPDNEITPFTKQRPSPSSTGK